MPPDSRPTELLDTGSTSEAVWFYAGAAAVALVGAAATCTAVYNYDVFWHLASGRWMLHSGRVLATDPFSVDPEPRWVNVHWLFQVVVASLHALGGFGALTVMKAVLAAVTLLVFALAVRRSGPPAWWIVCGLGTAAVMATRFRVRPEAFTMLLLTATVALVESVRRGGSPKRLWALPAVMLVWVNMHGLYFLGPAVFWSAVLGAALDRRMGRLTQGRLLTRAAIAPLLAASAVCLATPWPLEAAAQPLLLWTRISGEFASYTQDVSEFLPTWRSPFHVALAAAVCLPAAAACLLNIRRLPASHLAWLAAFAALALLARRNVALAAPPCGYLLALHGGALLRRLRRPRAPSGTPGLDRAEGNRKVGDPTTSRRPSPPRALPTALTTIAAILLALALTAAYATEWLFRLRGVPRRFGPGLYRDHYPVDVATRLGKLKAAGDIFCGNWGDAGTFIYHSRPRRLWMDGRLEAHSLDRFESQFRISKALQRLSTAGRVELPPSVRFFYVQSLSRDRLTALAQSPRFDLLMIDETGACFARTDWLAPTPQAARAGTLPLGNNLHEYDRPLWPGSPLVPTPAEPPSWWRQNPPPKHYRLGAMLLWLGWQDPLGRGRTAGPTERLCTRLAVRYLTAAMSERIMPRRIVQGMLAVAHQQRALQEDVTPGPALPVDYHSARALWLHRVRYTGDLTDDNERMFAEQRVDALIRARQLDTAERAVRDLLADLPASAPSGTKGRYQTLHERLAAMLAISRRRAESIGPDQPARARALTAPDVGLVEQAVRELEAATPTFEGLLTLGDLLLNQGNAAAARAEYDRAANLAADPNDVRFRLWLADAVAAAPHAPSDAAYRSSRPRKPIEAYYAALLLEQIGRYDEALAVIKDAAAEAPVADLIDRLRKRLILR